jgi:ABC-type transporter Mla maintaining outer membrane lipid asymmetry ATPase subunit MlaF
MIYRLEPRIIMLDAERILFDGTYEAFRRSNSPVIQLYFELMPKLHQRFEGSVDPAAQQSPS